MLELELLLELEELLELELWLELDELLLLELELKSSIAYTRNSLPSGEVARGPKWFKLPVLMWSTCGGKTSPVVLVSTNLACQIVLSANATTCETASPASLLL